ncbi:MAG: VanW family protein [Defluviitaleaceae bacterium]|nr:VanW family protein [Defluviitaleaceae bacterium]
MKKFFCILILIFLAGCSNNAVEVVPETNLSRNIRENLLRRQTIQRRHNVPVLRVPAENELPGEFSRNETENNFPDEYARTETENNFPRYETVFDGGDTNRAENISLAARAIDGKIVRPGEEFSYNKTVGSTTKNRGYKKAVIFAGGKKTKNYGGGVCQVSTTLCNAAINAGMTITERHDHSLPVNYVGDGIEAATSQRGKLDFRFVNEKNYPIRINAHAENGKINVSIEEYF